MYAENLKKIRKELRYTADETADILGVKPRTYGSWEREEAVPSMELGPLLYKKFNVNLNWFVSGEGEMFNKQSLPSNMENSAELTSQIEKILKLV